MVICSYRNTIFGIFRKGKTAMWPEDNGFDQQRVNWLSNLRLWAHSNRYGKAVYVGAKASGKDFREKWLTIKVARFQVVTNVPSICGV